MPESTPTYYSSRPTVTVDGRTDERLMDEILSVLVEETREGLARCELRVSNWGNKDGATRFLFVDRQLLDFGAELSVKLGPPGRSGEVFRGRITGLECDYPVGRPPELVALAEDALQDLRMTRRTRVFEAVSDGDVASALAGDHGLRVQVDHGGPTHDLLTQVNQSDLAFLRERALYADAFLWLEDGTLHFVDPARAERTRVTLSYGRELREVTVLADLAHQRTEMRVGGWDVQAKEGITGTATEAVVSSELAGLEGGAGILGSAFADHVDHVAHDVPFQESQATALAEGRFRNRARRFVTGVAHAEGDARVRVGSVVELGGLGALFEGEYRVTEARHTFDGERGYRTRFRIQRPGVAS